MCCILNQISKNHVIISRIYNQYASYSFLNYLPRMSLPPPKKPLDTDCCGSGCDPCVFDIYERQLQKWKSNKSTDVVQNYNKRYDLLSQICYKPFILLKVSYCASNAVILTYQPSINENKFETHIPGILPYTPGQYVMLTTFNFSNNLSNDVDMNMDKKQLKIRNKNDVSRDYTPVTIAEKQKNCVFDIPIKLYPNGVMSNYISNLKIGDISYIRGAFGEYKYTPNKFRKLFMFCAGTGIAPMFPIIKCIIENEDDVTFVELYYSCKTVDDVLFKEELYEYSKFWNFKYNIYLSNETDWISKSKNIHYGENIFNEKISFFVIKNAIECNKNNIFTLICGTDDFNKDINIYLEKCGVLKEFMYIF